MTPVFGLVLSRVLLALAFGASALLVGFAAGWWLLAPNRKEQEGGPSGDEDVRRTSAARAMRAIGQIHDVASRVAQEVDSHSSEVGKISAELQSLSGPGGSSFTDSAVGMIAKVLRANDKLQKQLAAAEDKLQDQAREIASHQNAARTDPLTGLPNRRAFDHEVARRFSEWQRNQTPFTLMLVDIDGFKKLNDTCGHQAGDAVLRQIAHKLASVTREMDLPCRYGGEEFVVVMPATPLDSGASAAERARAAIEELDVRWHGQALKVTASFGMAEIRPGEDTTSLMRRADEALYASKRAGRNCGHLHDGHTCRALTRGVEQPVPAPVPVRPPLPNVQLLSNLPAREQLERQMQRRVEESHRYGLPLSLMCVQVTGFDEVVTAHGREIADCVLDAVAQRLHGSLREMDFLARDALDAFAILLPGSSAIEARQVARRIATTQARQTIQVGGSSLEVSLAIGLASCQSGDDVASLRSRAEEQVACRREESAAEREPLTT